MARRRRTRYRRRRSRWSPNISKISNLMEATPGEWAHVDDLAVNSIPTGGGVTIPFTVKNFEITFTLDIDSNVASSYIDAVTAYIMYVPQGMTVTSAYYGDHPEYIMAYKYIGKPTTRQTDQSTESQQYQPQRVRTRLSRKLQTGDSIVLYVQGSNSADGSIPINISGIVRWWSKAN